MNIKKKFLTLSISHQIAIVFIILSVLCLLYNLAFFSLYTNIILNIRLSRRREYYYNKYEKIILGEIEFQTFLLHQYEQLIKFFNTQIYYYYKSKNDLYDLLIEYNKDLIKNYEDINKKNFNQKSYNDTYYILSFSKDNYINSKEYYFLASTYLPLHNKLALFRKFRIPYIGNEIQIINEYLFVNLEEFYLYSTNFSRIAEIEEDSRGNYSEYYENLIDSYVRKYKIHFEQFKKGKLDFINLFYEDIYYIFENYINETYISKNYKNNTKNYLYNVSFYFNFIDYDTGKTFLTDNGSKKSANLLQQNSIISDYLNMIFFLIQNSLNINVIPVYTDNSTIMSVDLCYSFLYKQMVFLNLTSETNIFSEDMLNEIYTNKLKKGESNIGDCILDEKYNFITGQTAYNILNIKFNKFFSIKNVREISLFKLSDTDLGKDYLCIKYTFPDIPSFLGFKPYFFNSDQLNLYCFKQFYTPKFYESNLADFINNVKFFIGNLLFYIWIIFIFYIILRLKKLFKEIVEPINNLIEVIEHLDVKEENMLKYEPDDSINELFKLCNNLLLGKYKQKIIHETELDKNLDQNENNNNDYFNLNINRKLIEEMIENKNEYNINRDEISTFDVNETSNNQKYKNSDNQLKKTLRKTLFNNEMSNSNNDKLDLINKIKRRIKKTQSLDQTIELCNKKRSLDVNLLKNTQIFAENYNENDEDIIEMEILLNYKQLYEITDLTINYDLKDDQKFTSKNSKLLYKSYKRGHSKYFKDKIASVLTLGKSSSGNFKDDLISKRETKIRIEDFDKSVLTTYDNKDMLFLWYKEAKYFNDEEFLQNNHNKELNNLCNINLGLDNSQINDRKKIDNTIYNSKTDKKDIFRKPTKNK